MYVDLDHVSKTIKGKAVLRDVSVDNEWGLPDKMNRTPIIGLKKFGFDDWRCGSFVCVRIGGSTMTTGSGARR